jgi:hypothetical protein
MSNSLTIGRDIVLSGSLFNEDKDEVDDNERYPSPF